MSEFTYATLALIIVGFLFVVGVVGPAFLAYDYLKEDVSNEDDRNHE